MFFKSDKVKKGFTLVKLLAVIVIIDIITISMINSVIEKLKLGAMEDSSYRLMD